MVIILICFYVSDKIFYIVVEKQIQGEAKVYASAIQQVIALFYVLKYEVPSSISVT